MTTLLTPAQVSDWGWRVPFLLGVLIVPVGLWLRAALEETHANEDHERTRAVSSLSVAFRLHLGKIGAGVALIIGGTAANAIIVLYMATYAVTQLKLPPTTGLFAGISAGLITLLAAPIGGILADRVGRKTVARWSYGLILLLIYPAFLYLNASPTLGTLVAIVVLLGALNAMGGAAIIITLAEIFRPRCARRNVARLCARRRDLRRLRTVHRDLADRRLGQPARPRLVCDGLRAGDAARPQGGARNEGPGAGLTDRGPALPNASSPDTGTEVSYSGGRLLDRPSS